MKIGLVRRGFSGTGGAETYLRRFAEVAAADGHECALFANGDWPAAAWTGTILRVSGRSPRAFANALEALRPHEQCDRVFSFERVWRCDVYRAGDGVHAVWLERRARYEPFWKPALRLLNGNHRALLALERALFARRGAGRVIANSRMVKTEIAQRFGYPAAGIEVIYNGVPPITLPPETRTRVRQELGLTPNDYVLLFAGSGWERKGLSCAIRAIRRAPSARPLLLVAGRGSRRGLPRSDRVRFLGPRPDMPRLLAAADVFLLPTIYEPFSNACLEALAAGLPVITTRSNGFAEIIEPGVDGEVVADPADARAIAQAIETWSDRAKRDAIKTRLQTIGARFSMDENVRQTLAVLQGELPPAALSPALNRGVRLQRPDD